MPLFRYLKALLQYFLQNVATPLCLGPTDCPPRASHNLSLSRVEGEGCRRALAFFTVLWTFCSNSSLCCRGSSTLHVFPSRLCATVPWMASLRACLHMNIWCLRLVLCERFTPRFPVETVAPPPFSPAAGCKALAKAVNQKSCRNVFFFSDLHHFHLFIFHFSPNNL